MPTRGCSATGAHAAAATSSRRRRSFVATRVATAPTSRRRRCRPGARSGRSRRTTTRRPRRSSRPNDCGAAGPCVGGDPFEPFSVAAVELPREKMVVLGQVADGVDPATLRVGDEVELVLATLFEDDDHEYVVWKWKPTGGAGS